MLQQVDFCLLDKARAVETSLLFSQATLNFAQKNVIRRAVAFQLSLPLENVIEKVYDVGAKQLYIAPSGSMPLIIAPIYTNPNFPDMMVYVGNLINTPQLKAYIKSKLSTFTDTATYTVTKYPLYTPFFLKVVLCLQES